MAQNVDIKTYTAPRAIIQIENQMAGYVRNISFSENVNRANVQGLGNFILQEAPPIGYACQFTVDQFFVDFQQPVMIAMMNRMGSVANIVDTLVLGEVGFSLVLYKKTIISRDSNTKLVTASDPTGQTIANIGPCFTTNQQFQLAEGGIAGYNVSGIYFNPISALNL